MPVSLYIRAGAQKKVDADARDLHLSKLTKTAITKYLYDANWLALDTPAASWVIDQALRDISPSHRVAADYNTLENMVNRITSKQNSTKQQQDAS